MGSQLDDFVRSVHNVAAEVFGVDQTDVTHLTYPAFIKQFYRVKYQNTPDSEP